METAEWQRHPSTVGLEGLRHHLDSSLNWHVGKLRLTVTVILFQVARLKRGGDLTRNKYFGPLVMLALRHRQKLGTICVEPENKVKVIREEKKGEDD